MTLDNLFKIGGELGVHHWRIAQVFGVSFRQRNRLRQQSPAAILRRFHHGNGTRVMLNDNLRTFAHAFQHRSEIPGRFGIRHVNDVLWPYTNYTSVRHPGTKASRLVQPVAARARELPLSPELWQQARAWKPSPGLSRQPRPPYPCATPVPWRTP